MSKEYKNDKMILIMDRAGWHKSKDLKIPDNIKIVYLPPYAPELNPVERLWQYIKSKILKNILYETIGELESVLCSLMKSLLNDTVKSICETQYMFN